MPKLLVCPQVMLVITHTKFGQNPLRHCGDIASFIFVQISSNSLTRFTRTVWSIGNLLITFCQHCLKMIRDNFDENQTNCLGQTNLKKMMFRIIKNCETS